MRSPPNHFSSQFWTRLEDGRVQCDVCPQHCQLRDGKRGICFVRMNHDGEIVLTSYGRSSGFCIDPIEKKPLNHFYPGSSVLSFGTAGCNLTCKFCQNWDMSKSRQLDTLADTAMPEQLAIAAHRYGCQSIAYTYNDPVIFLEYAVDVAKACNEKGVKNVAVTAGYVCDKPRELFFQNMDAANIDLKAFSEGFYKKICHGQLQPVLDTLLYLKHETEIWFEITTLLIPGENDSDQELFAMCQWLYEHLGPEVPLHFTAFHPDFKMMDTQRTPVQTLLRARKIAYQCGLHYVYCGNVHDPKSASTYCPRCKKCVIERDWYELGRINLDRKGQCGYCNTIIAGRFAPGFLTASGSFGHRRVPVRMNSGS